MTVIPYPPSSLVVALCHFFLFQNLKMGLKGMIFNDDDNDGDDDDDMIQAELQDGLGQISCSALH